MRRTGLAALRVPTTRQVTAGAHVAIVLKADQPTGRTVSGVVRDVLTRGDHPRGIKVRLADGRVGRVQAIVPAGTAIPDGATGATDGEVAGPAAGTLWSGRRGRDGGRGEDDERIPTREVGLDAYLKPAKQKARGKKRALAGSAAATGELSDGSLVDKGEDNNLAVGDEPETAKCPVCEAFEGDEAAVAHHVASHFDT
jgi:uncharacterized repeat protein (TIGR03833 family)